jgi:chaperone modulatory protein CbpM
MMRLGDLLAALGIAEAELLRWIDSGWVHPEGEPGAWIFRDIDVARVRLIIEIRHDLEIDEDALPVVLSLLDQLYGLRRDLGALCGAVAAQPPEVRAAIAAALAAARGEG